MSGDQPPVTYGYTMIPRFTLGVPMKFWRIGAAFSYWTVGEVLP